MCDVQFYSVLTCEDIDMCLHEEKLGRPVPLGEVLI